MSLENLYAGLRTGTAPGVPWERVVERTLAEVLGEWLETEVLEGHRALPKYFESWKRTEEGGTPWGGFAEAVEEGDRIIVMGEGYREEQGLEYARVRILIETHCRTAGASDRLAAHDARCAGVRGMLSQAAMGGAEWPGVLALLDAAAAAHGGTVQGYERSDETERSFEGMRWLCVETYEVWGGMSVE